MYFGYAEFYGAVHAWIARFGLTDWNVHVCYDALPPEDHSCVARTYMNWTQRSARIVLNSGHVPPTVKTTHEQTADDLACHEVLHIVLAVYGNTIEQTKDYGSPAADSEEHAVIRRVMRALKKESTA